MWAALRNVFIQIHGMTELQLNTVYGMCHSYRLTRLQYVLLRILKSYPGMIGMANLLPDRCCWPIAFPDNLINYTWMRSTRVLFSIYKQESWILFSHCSKSLYQKTKQWKWNKSLWIQVFSTQVNQTQTNNSWKTVQNSLSRL